MAPICMDAALVQKIRAKLGGDPVRASWVPDRPDVIRVEVLDEEEKVVMGWVHVKVDRAGNVSVCMDG